MMKWIGVALWAMVLAVSFLMFGMDFVIMDKVGLILDIFLIMLSCGALDSIIKE